MSNYQWLTCVEMSDHEQFFYLDFHHIGVGHRSRTSITKNVESSQRPNDECLGGHAKTDGQHQEFWRIPRDAAPGKSALYPILRYAVSKRMGGIRTDQLV